MALKYKQLWMVEDIFRSMKSLLDTRPMYHKCDETIRGHVFCSFLALLLRRELEDCWGRKGWKLEWANLIRDLENLVEMEVTIGGMGYVFRGQTPGETGEVFALRASLQTSLYPRCSSSTLSFKSSPLQASVTTSTGDFRSDDSTHVRVVLVFPGRQSHLLLESHKKK